MAQGKFSQPRPHRDEERQIEKTFRQLTGQEPIPKPEPGLDFEHTETSFQEASPQSEVNSAQETMGDDLFGRYCYRDFAIHGIDLSHAYLREGKTTDIGVVLSEDETHGRNILYRRGNYERIRQDEIDFSFLEQGRYLFIALVDELHMAAAKYAKKHGVKVLIDADSRPMDYYEEILPYVDYFVASEFVYNMSFSDRDYERHMEDILEKGPSAVVFTFGSKGCRGLDKEGYFELPAFRVPVVDTVGAGDTFHGAFFYGLTHGYSLKETARFASAVSAIPFFGFLKL